MWFEKFSILIFFNLIIVGVGGNLQWETPNDALDNSLYEEVLDPELCDEQLRFVASDPILRLRFLDAGMKTPRGILIGNTLDLGNYHQCLDITQQLENSDLQGKYCMVRVPLSQSYEFEHLPEIPGVEFDPRLLTVDNGTRKGLEQLEIFNMGLRAMGGMTDTRLMAGSPLSAITFRLAVCIPKPCSTEQAINSLLFNVTALGFKYQDDFCRLPDDKPWAPADTAAVVVFSVLGLVTLLSTCYDVHYTFTLKKDPRTISPYGRLFSVYSNGRRLMAFSSGPGTLQCVDGVRALAMMWVLVGHAFTSESHFLNPLDTFQWSTSFGALWLTGAHITVDTFFLLSGLLVVYTTAGKITGMKLLKTIHLFYLNRLLRMFPLLAAGVLLEASFFNRMTDGPDWGTIVIQTDRCRTFWWSTLLHIQNYLNPAMTCISQSWYLAVDVQLHIISPIILFLVLSGRKLVAWTGLVGGLLAILVASTTYIFIKEFPSSMGNVNRGDQIMYYFKYYYINTLTRGSPFFVGMIFGYLLHLWRDEKIKLSKLQAIFLWILSLAISTFVMYASYPILQVEWDNQNLDSLYNSFIRPLWATAVGCMLFLCIQGYGGPINWFLSLQMWKLPARISYAMYIFHWALMTAINSTAVAPSYFTPGLITFKTLAHFGLTFVVAFFMTIIVDSPFSTIFKLLLGKTGPKKHKLVHNETQVLATTKDDKTDI